MIYHPKLTWLSVMNFFSSFLALEFFRNTLSSKGVKLESDFRKSKTKAKIKTKQNKTKQNKTKQNKTKKKKNR